MNNFTIELSIPAADYIGYRDRIERHWMLGASPILSRHRPMYDGAYEYASFTSQHPWDIDYALGILPAGSAAMGPDGWVSYRPNIRTMLTRVRHEIASRIDHAFHGYKTAIS